MTTTPRTEKDRATTLGAVKKLVQKQMINAGRVDLDLRWFDFHRSKRYASSVAKRF